MTNITTAEAEYVKAADLARMIRKALKAEFPGIKFSVRSRTFAGGSSVDVTIPLDADVDDAAVRAVADAYQTKSFDGMIDMSFHAYIALDADDRIVGSQSDGTVGSLGSVPAHDTTDTYECATKVARYIYGSTYVSTGRDWR